jgi:hypothetical protein
MRRKCQAKAATNLLISVPHSSDRENSCQVFNPLASCRCHRRCRTTRRVGTGALCSLCPPEDERIEREIAASGTNPAVDIGRQGSHQISNKNAIHIVRLIIEKFRLLDDSAFTLSNH